MYHFSLSYFSDRKSLTGFTPLQIAARSGNLEMCRLILENVNDKSPIDANGKTPKDVAEEFNHLEIVKLFS